MDGVNLSMNLAARARVRQGFSASERFRRFGNVHIAVSIPQEWVKMDRENLARIWAEFPIQCLPVQETKES